MYIFVCNLELSFGFVYMYICTYMYEPWCLMTFLSMQIREEYLTAEHRHCKEIPETISSYSTMRQPDSQCMQINLAGCCVYTGPIFVNKMQLIHCLCQSADSSSCTCCSYTCDETQAKYIHTSVRSCDWTKASLPNLCLWCTKWLNFLLCHEGSHQEEILNWHSKITDNPKWTQLTKFSWSLAVIGSWISLSSQYYTD